MNENCKFAGPYQIPAAQIDIAIAVHDVFVIEEPVKKPRQPSGGVVGGSGIHITEVGFYTHDTSVVISSPFTIPTVRR